MKFQESEDKNTLNFRVTEVYSSVFSVLTLVLLISFVSKVGPSLTSFSNDFRWKNNLITMYSSFRFKVGDQVYNSALIGKEGWIFYTGDRNVQEYQKVDSLNKNTLMIFARELNRLNKELGKEGRTLLVVIPPNKGTIYSQYMPDQIPVIGQKSPLDQFVEYMKQNGDIPILDLRPTLLDASRSQGIYYKTDTHWNDVGAYYGYVTIMRTLARDYPALLPHPITDFEYRNIGTSTRDLPLLMGLPNYKEENWFLVPKFEVDLKETSAVLSYGADHTRTVTNSDSQLPKLMVFHDSFYVSLSHFIEPHFSSTVTIPYTNKKNIWSLDWIEQENPNIVIIEIVERYLDISLPELFEN